jgi:hypothetical protein
VSTGRFGIGASSCSNFERQAIRLFAERDHKNIVSSNVYAVVALLGFDLFFINDEAAASFHFEIAPIAFVADQTFVTATTQLLL